MKKTVPKVSQNLACGDDYMRWTVPSSGWGFENINAINRKIAAAGTIISSGVTWYKILPIYRQLWDDPQGKKFSTTNETDFKELYDFSSQGGPIQDIPSF